jgi:hypothetical protein
VSDEGPSRREVEFAAQVAASPLIVGAMVSGEVSKAKAAELVRANELSDDVQVALVGDAASAPVEQVAAAVDRARLAHGVPRSPVGRPYWRSALTPLCVLPSAMTLTGLPLAQERMESQAEGSGAYPAAGGGLPRRRARVLEHRSVGCLPRADR